MTSTGFAQVVSRLAVSIMTCAFFNSLPIVEALETVFSHLVNS